MENTYSQLTDSGIKEFDIIILGLGENSYKLLKGEEYLNNMLSANGEFPKPVGFIDFQTVCDVKLFFGPEFNPIECWSIHPNIVKCMRAAKQISEIDA